jgi:hypothetical protein
MKKYGPGLLVGLTTFLIGSVFVFAVWSNNYKYCELSQFRNQPTENLPNTNPMPNGQVEFRFLGFGSSKGRPTLKFEIINLTNFPIGYIEYGENTPATQVRLNGKDIGWVWLGGMDCGEGKTLDSNESLKKEFFADLEIFNALHKKGNFEFGYYIYSKKFKDKVTIWSGPITFPDDLKKEIIKNKPDFLIPFEQKMRYEKKN